MDLAVLFKLSGYILSMTGVGVSVWLITKFKDDEKFRYLLELEDRCHLMLEGVHNSLKKQRDDLQELLWKIDERAQEVEKKYDEIKKVEARISFLLEEMARMVKYKVEVDGLENEKDLDFVNRDGHGFY